MENKEYLNEEKYQNSNKKLKKAGKVVPLIGIIMLIIGVAMIIFAIVKFGNTVINFSNTDMSQSINRSKSVSSIFGSFGLFFAAILIIFIGFGLTSFGGVLAFTSHGREIISYSTQQVMPVAQEKIEKMAPTLGKAAGVIAKSVKDGLTDDKQ